jgi:hypothetical protein
MKDEANEHHSFILHPTPFFPLLLPAGRMPAQGKAIFNTAN